MRLKMPEPSSGPLKVFKYRQLITVQQSSKGYCTPQGTEGPVADNYYYHYSYHHYHYYHLYHYVAGGGRFFQMSCFFEYQCLSGILAFFYDF